MPTLLGRIKDVMFWIDQIQPDRMGKMDGHFFNKARNELQQAICEEESELHQQVFGRSPFSDPDSIDQNDS